MMLKNVDKIYYFDSQIVSKCKITIHGLANQTILTHKQNSLLRMSYSVLTKLEYMQFLLCENEQNKFVHVLRILDN
jgi:hypothetical protein